LAVFTGTTLPIFGAAAAALYGILSFAEQEFVKSIEVIKDGEHNGKFLITVGTTVLTSRKIIADIRDI
jgi:hypothetical protein